MRKLLGLLCVSVLSGCLWAPGQHMDTGSFHEKDVDMNDFRKGVNIQPINGALVRRLKHLRTHKSAIVPDVLKSHIESYHYHIEPQDILNITVWDHPELTAPGGTFQSQTGNLVYADGTIFYPYIGVVDVAGKTMEQVRVELADKLKAFIETPQLEVQVKKFRSQYAYVTGQVKVAGKVAITDTPLTIMSLIAQSGGVLPTADLRHVTLTRQHHTYVLDLFSLYERGDVSFNVLLKHGDIVNIPDNQLNKVFVMGAVSKPSTLLIPHDQMSLAEAISDVNGFAPSSNPSQVYVIRGKRLQNAKESVADRFEGLAQLEVYHLDASSPDALILADQFHLQSRDVVYVSTTELKRFSGVFADVSRVINTTAQTLILKKAAGF